MSEPKMFQPETLEEALSLLAEPGTMACAGATNLYVDRRHGKYLDQDYVSLDRLEELRGIRREADGWHMGAMTSFADLERCEIPFAGALAAAASQVGGPQIRNRGTLGGNIVSASPAADSVPPLLALDARLRLERAGGRKREVPLGEFMVGPGRTAREPGELLTEVILGPKNGKSIFYKAGKRNALAISLCSCAVYMDVSGGRIVEIGVALGSVAPTAVRAGRAEAVLRGSAAADLTDRDFQERLRSALMEDIAPIDDIRATAEYRRRIAFRMALHNVTELWRCFQ